ncbi:MAG: ATP-dependent Clp protease ATP-binding subunit, partial [Bacteroidota bacterium]
RIDDVIMFNNLSREDIHQIIDIELKNLYKRMEDLGYKIKLTESAKDFISDKGFDPNYGARPLKRAIQKYLEDPLAEEIIKAKLAEGDVIEVDFDTVKSEITIQVIKAKKKKAKEE